MNRRHFLQFSGLTLLGAGALGGWVMTQQTHQPLLLSARNDAAGRHYAVGFHLDGSQAFSTQVASRCHDISVHPHQPLALFVGRRPGTESYLIDCHDGRLLQTLRTPADRHFYGHAVFHKDGEWLYSTENDTREPGRGVLGAWRLVNGQLQRHSELSTHGIGPHQLLWLPDGETLVVANGGIRTEADSREATNLNAMESSLVLMGRDGNLFSRERLANPLNSIRHLAVAADGTIACGQQYQGEPSDAVPLLAVKRPGQPLQDFPVAAEQRQAMQQYCASLAIHNELRLLALTAPRGNRLLIWDLDNARLRLDVPLPDCAGVGAIAEGFVVSSGVGRCRRYDCRTATISSQPLELPAGLWDNHLRLA
ncbi:MAG: hypothetical protein CFE49_04125 [Pseudomonas sp. PGPPP3]|nr:MAG: hypothetical protein CFE49_04125 [Pseudomonas sp. PGPPP3]